MLDFTVPPKIRAPRTSIAPATPGQSQRGIAEGGRA